MLVPRREVVQKSPLRDLSSIYFDLVLPSRSTTGHYGDRVSDEVTSGLNDNKKKKRERRTKPKELSSFPKVIVSPYLLDFLN